MKKMESLKGLNGSKIKRLLQGMLKKYKKTALENQQTQLLCSLWYSISHIEKLNTA